MGYIRTGDFVFLGGVLFGAPRGSVHVACSYFSVARPSGGLPTGAHLRVCSCCLAETSVSVISPRSINVFTWGPHARRSRLVFAKVEGAETEVGVFAWTPSRYQTLPWWRSSDRAKELLTETAGYLFEVLLNSGRRPDETSANYR